MTYLGIDPGLDGALAILNEDGEISWFIDQPTVKVGKRRLHDPVAMANFLNPVVDMGPGVFATIEKQQPFPKQGGVSNWTGGKGYGIWLGILAALGIPFQEVTPKKWQKSMLTSAPGASSKGAALLVAKQRWPQSASAFTTERGRHLDGRTDAALIAEYGRLHVW